MDEHRLEGLKRFIKKKGVRYFETLSDEEKKPFEGVLFSNGIFNTFVLNLLLS